MLNEIVGPHWALHFASIAFGLSAYALAWHSSCRFDRKYGPKA